MKTNKITGNTQVAMALAALVILTFVPTQAEADPEAMASQIKLKRRPSHNIYGVSFRPASPAQMIAGDRVYIRFNYAISDSGGAHVYPYPRHAGQIVPHQNAPGPLLQKGSGSSSTWCTVLNAPVLIDGIELRMYNSDHSEVLFTKVYDVHYDFDVFKVTDVTVSVSEENYQGPCPHKFEFTGKITVNSGGTVKYRWTRSDGATSTVETLVFRMAGTQTVTTSWTLGGAGREYRNYWRAIEIIEPNPLTSNKARFTLVCDD